MIFVDRKRVQAPVILTDADGAGAKEKAAAITYYSGGPVSKAFDFKIYRHQQVKDALVELFYGKCAYCESSFIHVYAGDVEHFRPKGEIEEAAPDKKPGYYWLASDWDNLLLSCRNCNQKLTHAVYGEMDRTVMGKMNQFPLAPPGAYVRRHGLPGDIGPEEFHRLLINPCIDKPEEYLEYGEQGVIKAKKKADGSLHEKGVTSIRVFVLQRVPLVLSRERWLIDIQAQIQRVKEAFMHYNGQVDSKDTVKLLFFEKVLKREMQRLKKFLDPREQYVGMARQVIGEFLRENFEIDIR